MRKWLYRGRGSGSLGDGNARDAPAEPAILDRLAARLMKPRSIEGAKEEIAMQGFRNGRPTASIGAVALLLMLIGCNPVTVSTGTSPTADFTNLHTYAWEPNPQMGGTLDDSIAGQEIHAAVNDALEARGFRPAAGAPPDFLVDYHVTERNESEITGGRWNVEEFHYTEGTLLVALVDPKSKLFLWQGTAESVVDTGGPSSEQIQQAVQKMFADFPS
jgi:Domain of unknown function (DUF4136)